MKVVHGLFFVVAIIILQACGGGKSNNSTTPSENNDIDETIVPEQPVAPPVIVIDAPRIKNLSVDQGQVVTGTFNVSFEVDDLHGLEALTLEFSGTSYPFTDIKNPSVWIYTKKIEDGEHTIKIHAVSFSGEETTLERSVIVANSVITFSNVYPDNNETIFGIYEFKGDLSHFDWLLGVTVFIDDVDNYANVLGDDFNSRFKSRIDTTNLTDGLHTLRVRATNRLNFYQEWVIKFHVNNTSPVVQWALNDGDYIEKDYLVSASVTDLSTIGNVELYINDTLLKTYQSLENVAYSLDTSFYPDGPHTLKIIASDEDSNITVIEKSIFIDNTPPVVWMNTKSDITVKSYFSLSFGYSDVNGFGDTSHEVFIDNEHYSDVTNTSLTREINPFNRPNGWHVIKLTVIDASGKESSVSINVNFQAR